LHDGQFFAVFEFFPIPFRSTSLAVFHVPEMMDKILVMERRDGHEVKRKITFGPMTPPICNQEPAS
jgi:hypothetical protein